MSWGTSYFIGGERARGLDAEKEAAEFASVFLMPEGSVLANAPQGGTLNQLIAAKRKWSVSLRALVYRMHALDLLTDWQYRSLFIEISKKGLRKKERNGIRPETSKLLSKVFASMLEDGVTRNAVADDLANPSGGTEPACLRAGLNTSAADWSQRT